MLFALDPLNIDKIFPANQAVKRKIYLCPFCKEKVTARSVGQYSKKLPYFAHLPGLGNKDCENYVKSNYTYTHNSGSILFNDFLPTTFKNLSNDQSKISTKNTKNLYLKINENVLELYFSFKIYVAHPKWDGDITINGLKGVIGFDSNTISSEEYIHVDFNFNENNIGKDGQVDSEIFEFLLEDIPKVNGEVNIFHAPYSSGKLLRESDNIYMGETYIIAINESYKMSYVLSDLIQNHYKVNNIDFYQIELADEIGLDVKFTIESFLKKNIQPKRPSIKLIDPLPERFGIDNSIYVSNKTQNLIISYDCDKEFLDWIPINGIKEYDDQYFDKNTLNINVTNINGIDLYWKKSFLFRIIKAHTNTRDNFGLTLINGDDRFNLIDSRIKNNLLVNAEFTIDLDWSTNNKTFQIREGVENSLVPIIKNKIYHFVHGLEIEAGSFGYCLFLNKKSCITKQEDTIDVPNGPREKWIKSIRLLSPVTPLHLNRNGLEEQSLFSNITNSHNRAIHKINLNKVIK